MPLFTNNPVGRTLLFPQFSANPCTLSPAVTLSEMRGYAVSLSFDALLHARTWPSARRSRGHPEARFRAAS